MSEFLEPQDPPLEPHEQAWLDLLAHQDKPTEMWLDLLNLLTLRPELLESWRLGRKGRRKGSGAAFRDEADFFAKTFAVIHDLEQDGVDPTRENVAGELMTRGVFQTSNVDTAVKNLSRALRRYHLSYSELVARTRQS
jgi:hypothetical protein